MATRAGSKEDAPPGAILLVVHDFVARSTDELSLAKGDRIELIERDDEFGDGWFLGRHLSNAKTGLFPEVYTTSAPKGTFNQPYQQRRASDGPPRTPQNGDTISHTSPMQMRHFSNSAVSPRPTSGSNGQNTSMSSMASSAAPALRTSVASSMNTPPRINPNPINADSPVMSETLSVIDEHMNSMHTPRTSYVNGNKRDTTASGSVYSNQALNRMSYIAGHETDEEEHQLHTQEEVDSWSPNRVAEYLEDHGVEPMHCEVFKEQEISGDVLLAMDQSSLFLKEFDLGPVGRRLKLWAKVKALQDEVARSANPPPPKSTSEYSGGGDDVVAVARNRSSTLGTVPRALDTSSRQSAGERELNSVSFPQAAAASAMQVNPLQNTTSIERRETTRISPHDIRQMQSSRRHSSIDATQASTSNVQRQNHRKQPSLDQQWQPGQLQTRTQPSGSGAHGHTLSTDAGMPKRQSTAFLQSSPEDLDRGYFSSHEFDGRARLKKNALKRGNSTTSVQHAISHSQNSLDQEVRPAAQAPRMASADALRPPPSPGTSGPGAPQGLFSAVSSRFSNFRSATTPQMQNKPSMTTQESSPVVTKLEYNGNNANMFAPSPTSTGETGPSPTNSHFAFFGRKGKPTGLRTASDTAVKTEKGAALIPSPIKEGGIASPTKTESTTPSTETRSIDLQKAEAQSRTSQGSGQNLAPPPSSQRRPRPKTKKATSAYTRGLLKKAPSEQMEGCDYSGWMKKKSGSLMTTWKSRLFVLRGRRLSYYYADNDTEEKGLIDISFHRVLPANNDTLTGLHASLTGAAANPTTTSPKDATTFTTAQKDLQAHPPPATEPDDASLFIFKLVPPKAGLSKGVNFTKPTVHYFAVNSRQEGRLWMAALMKATIDRDADGHVTTSYNQATISLAKARARRERPPALQEDGEAEAGEAGDEKAVEAGAEAGPADDGGDGNRGLGIVAGAEGGKPTAAVGVGAERDDASSLAPGTMTPGTESDALNEREREAVAMNP